MADVNTTPGNLLVSLSVGGISEGWVFTVTGDGPDDSLFEVSGNKVVPKASTYVPPGEKSVSINAVKGVTSITNNVRINVKDYVANGFSATDILEAEAADLPATWANVFEISAAVYFTDVAAQQSIFGINATNQVRINASGVWEFVESGSVIESGGLAKVTTWHDVRLVGIDDGGLEISLFVDGVNVLGGIPTTMWADAADVFLGSDASANFLTGSASNFKITRSGTIYISEELSVDEGILLEAGTVTFGELKEDL